MPKISALPASSVPASASLAPIVVDGVTSKVALSAFPVSTATTAAIATERRDTKTFIPARTASPGSIDLLAATLSLSGLQRPFNIVEPGFESVKDDFSTLRGGYTAGTLVASGGTGNVAVAGGIVRCVSSSAPKCAWWGATVKVVAMPASTPVVGVGIANPADVANTFILAYYDGTNIGCIRRAGVGDAAQTMFPAVAVSLTAPFRLAIAQTENCVAVWYDVGNGWVQVGVALVTGGTDYTAVDFRNYRYYLYASGTGTAKFDDFTAGAFGCTGLPSPYVLTYDDGSPMVDGRSQYVMMAAGGLNIFVTTDAGSASTYRTTHNAVYKWNVDSDSLVCTGKIFTTRTVSSVVHVWGDAFGPAIYDRAACQFEFFPQNTGNFTSVNAAKVLRCSSKSDIRHGIHILDSSTELPLTAQGVSPNWDLATPFRDANGLWNWFYSRTNLARPTLDRSTSLTAGFAQIATDNTRTNEGGRSLNYFGRIYFLAGAPYTYVVYDANAGYIGTMAIPSTAPQYGSAPSSHPMITSVTLPTGGTKYRLITFTSQNYSGSNASTTARGTYGDIVAMDLSVTSATAPFELPIIR